MSRLGTEIDCELECDGYGAQPELPLEEDVETLADDDGDQVDLEDSELSGIGNRIAALHDKRNREKPS